MYVGLLIELVIGYDKNQRETNKNAKEEWLHSCKVGVLLQTQL